MERFDPNWVRHGVFDLSVDNPHKTRTIQVRKALEELTGTALQLRKNPARGRASTYYLREGDRGEVEAQFVMSLDAELRTLLLGISVEKGHEHGSAAEDHKMDRCTWDWSRFVALESDKLGEHVAAVSERLQRPVTLLMMSRKVGDERQTILPFVFAGSSWLLRSATVSAELVHAYIGELDSRRDSWVDAWIAADFNEMDVGGLSPAAAADVLFAFQSLRGAIRPAS